jgi:hypothetical protein
VTAERLAVLQARVERVNVDREKDRVLFGAGVAMAVGVAGLPAVAGAILAVAFGRAGVRIIRREVAAARLIAFAQRLDVDLRVAPER